MKNPLRTRHTLCVLVTGALCLTGGATFAANIWDGGGADANWATVNNWDNNAAPSNNGNPLSFRGSTRTTTTNNLFTSFNQIYFQSASPFTITGTAINMFDFGGAQAKIENNGNTSTNGSNPGVTSTGLATIALPITFAATAGNNWAEINAVTGNITFTGGLTVNGSQVAGVKLFGAGQTVNFNSTVNATGKYFGYTSGSGGNTINIGSNFTSGDWYVMNGATLNLASGGSLTTTALRLGGDFGNTGTTGDLTKGGTFQLTNTAGGQTFSSTINTVTGNSSNALNINSLNTTGTNTISSGIFLDSNLAVSQSSGGTLSLTGSNIDLKAQTLSVRGSGGTVVIGDSLINSGTGGGQLVVGTNGTANSGGTVVLTSSNTYNGETFVRNGTLAFSGTGSSNSSTIRLGSTSGTGVDATVAFANAAGGQTISSTINPVTTSGSGVTTLASQNTSGTNTYSGHIGMDRDMTITQSAGGTLAITQARAGGAGTTTGTDIKGFTLNLNGNGTNSTFNVSGDIYNSTGSGNVVIKETTANLSGANTYSGTTTVQNAVANANSSSAFGTSAVTVNGATVSAANGTTIANNMTVNNGVSGAAAGTSTTSQNFNSLGSGLPAGWSVYGSATANSLGGTVALTSTATAWSDSAGAWKNSAASTGLTDTATSAAQAASSDRALGVRQSGGFGDTGAAAAYNFNTTGTQVSAVSFDLMMLSVQPRSTTWSVQFGVGASPTSWTTIGTWADPGVFGATTFTFDTTNTSFSALSNQSDVWFRLVALNASTGSGNRDTIGIDNFSLTLTNPTSTIGSNVVNASATYSGTVTLNSSANLTAASGGTVTFSNTIADGTGTNSVTKVGAGTVIVTGSNTYAGGTTVTAGTLLVNNTTGSGTGTGSVTVNSTGTLGGTGTITAAVGGSSIAINGGGTITGATNGTVGSLTLQAPNGVIFGGSSGNLSTYLVDLNASTSDKLAILGNLDLSSAFDQISFAGTTGAASYQLLTYSGSLSGTFDTVSSLPTGYTLSYATPGEIDLVAIPEPGTWAIGSLAVLTLTGYSFRRRRARQVAA